MSNHWNRDPNFDYQRFEHRNDEITDEDIERLRPKPGHLERLISGAAGIVSRRHRRPHHQTASDPLSYAGAALPGADFTRHNLERANFQGANLQRAVFTGARLQYARFDDADLRQANLAEAIMTGANLEGADLSGANLIGTDFNAANLCGANLAGAYIWGADFHDANVDGTDFTGAYAGGALFSHARNLTLHQFRSTIHDETGAYRLSMLPEPPGGKKT